MKLNNLLLIAIFLFGFLIRFGVLMQAGEMYDEIAVVRNGEIYLGGIKNLDFSDNIWRINYEHPPVAKYIFGLGGKMEKAFPFFHRTFDSDFHLDKGYFLARMISLFMGLITIFMVYKISRKWFGKNVGLLSAAFLVLMPHFISHNVIAGLETPQAFFSVFLVYFYIEGITDKTPNLKKIHISFIFFAFLFLTKFSGAFYLFFYLTVISILLFINKIKIDKHLIMIHLLGLILFFAIIYSLWPWLWHNPLKLLESFKYFTNSHSGEYFVGSLSQPSWYYYFAYFIGTTPPILLVFAITSILFLKRSTDKLYYLFVIIWFFTPFVASFLGLKQDGVRYVFSYIPPLAILSGIGLNEILLRIKHKILWIFIIFVSFLSIFWSLYKFYPYYLDYYNSIFGGVAIVYERRTFDFAWWGEGIKESVHYVNGNYDDISVFPILHPAHTAPLFKDGITVQPNYDPLNKPDVILISEYFFYMNKIPIYLSDYKQIETINVNKIPLVRIYSLIK